MTEQRTRRLLRECIREVLLEDEAYGGLGGMGGYGMHYASKDQMYKIFVKPFVDVADVAIGKTKELSEKTKTLQRVAFEAVATTLIPNMSDDYEDIFRKEKESIDKIRSQYADVYKATWDAFQDEDIMIAAFMYRPDLFLTTQFARKAPKATMEVLKTLPEGNLLFPVLKKIAGAFNVGKSKYESSFSSEPQLNEEEDDEKNSGVEKLVSLVKNKKVKELLANSPKTQKMSKVGQEVVRNTLKNVLTQASAVLQAKSLEDLQSKLGKKLPGVDKLQQIPQEEREPAVQQLLATIKKSMKEFYVKQLEGQVKKAIEVGVPQDHPFVNDYANAISKVKSL